jgi:hypothetical protein
MEIIYKDRNFKLPSCELKLSYLTKAESTAKIYTYKKYIVKIFEKMNKPCEKEINGYLLAQKCKNKYVKNNFQKYYLIGKCEERILFFMDRNDTDINKNYLENISKDKKIDILKQCIKVIYEFNHKCNLYFNDIYYNNEIRNIMLKDDIVKIIDYGTITDKPIHNLLFYTQKIFPELNKKQIYSDLLLFVLFYIMNCCNNKEIKKIKDFFKAIVKEINPKTHKELDDNLIKILKQNNYFI